MCSTNILCLPLTIQILLYNYRTMEVADRRETTKKVKT
uniref:Uncharacterized protein n=1 Tax=Arundo donax TaxID=35708 RepID=A0A0A9EQY9_ARUDO